MSAQDLIVCKNFKLIKKLGTGAFGQIYLAENRTNKEQKYAAKLQEATTKFPQLYFEAKIYKYLTSSGNVVGIPKIHAMSTQGKYNIMLMDLLGKSLQDIFVDHNKKFSLKTTIMLGEQMLDRIEFLHEKQIIHRDIKPDNFLMGIGKNSHVVYMIDLGLSKKYIKDNKHIPYKEGKQLTGTARYASINTHMGFEQARRDDIEAIGYVLMYFLRGILPWQNMKAKDTKAKYQMIMEKKMSTPAEVLCKGFPSQMTTFINYAKGLKFQEKPDYNYLRTLLNSAKKNNKIVTDYVYDWTGEIEKNPPKQITFNTKKTDSMNKMIGSQNKYVEQPKLTTALTLEKEKKNIPIGNKFSSVSKNPIVTSTNNIIPLNNKQVMIGNPLNTKNDFRNTNKSKMKTNPTGGFGGIGNLQALGSKILGPKISVVKR